MAQYFDFTLIENIFGNAKKEEYPEDKSLTAQNPEHTGDGSAPLNSELDYDQENIDFEDEENNYYSLRDNTHNDAKLLFILTLGTLISLGILANSILT